MTARYRWLIGYLIAATTTLAGCGRHRTDRIVDPASRDRADVGLADAAEHEREDAMIDDYFYLQRRLPDGRMNVLQRARALTHARFLRARTIAFTGLDAEGTW